MFVGINVFVMCIALILSEDSSNDACNSGLCECVNTTVSCIGLNLTYIPFIPGNTTILRFQENCLPSITFDTFVNITSSELTEINMEGNQITIINNNAFSGLHKIQRLRLSRNPLSKEAVNAILKYVSTSEVDFLQLNHIGLKFIPNDFFEGMGTSKLTYLYLSENHIETFNFTLFKAIPLLCVLDLHGNNINSATLDYGPNMENLLLSSNALSYLPQFCTVNEEPYLPKLRYMDLVNNTITAYKPKNMNCMKELKTLKLSSNAMNIIKNNSFSMLPALTTLEFSSQKSPTYWFRLEAYAFNNSNLQVLELFLNNIILKHVHPLAFAGCDEIRKLDISNNGLTNYVDDNKMNLVLSPLTSLQTLLMYNIRMRVLPSILGKLTQLTTFDARSNKLQSWSKGFWVNNTKLRVLRLQFNMIITVTETMFPDYVRNRLTAIGLSNNPYNCNCDLVWFIKWVHRDSNKFWRYPDGYTCLNITERICMINIPAFISIIAVTCILIFVIILASLIYKYRWFIKYQIYIWKHQPKLLLASMERQYIYDVFVSYAIDDSDWVMEKLLPKLEQDMGLKLCIHERDFLGGKLIIDNIVQSIENSCRVLIVLSNSFAKSEWCCFEMNLAQRHVLDLTRDPLMVVLLEEINSEYISKSLHALLTTTTYMTYNNDTSNLFWERLKRSVSTP